MTAGPGDMAVVDAPNAAPPQPCAGEGRSCQPAAPKKSREDRHKGRRVLDDGFVMHSYKIKMCTRTSQHNWKLCPWAHPGETAAARRPPHMHQSELCPDVRMGRECSHGDACQFARNAFEQWLHPDRYRTTMCESGPGCQRPVCWFAHDASELRRPANAQPGRTASTSPVGQAPAATLVRLPSASMGLSAEQRLTSMGSSCSSAAGSVVTSLGASGGHQLYVSAAPGQAVVVSCPAQAQPASPQAVYVDESGAQVLLASQQIQHAGSARELAMMRLASLSHQHQAQMQSQNEMHSQQLAALQAQQRSQAQQLRDAQARETSALLQALQKEVDAGNSWGGPAAGAGLVHQHSGAALLGPLSSLSSEALPQLSSDALAPVPGLSGDTLGGVYSLGQLGLSTGLSGDESAQLMMLSGGPPAMLAPGQMLACAGGQHVAGATLWV